VLLAFLFEVLGLCDFLIFDFAAGGMPAPRRLEPRLADPFRTDGKTRKQLLDVRTFARRTCRRRRPFEDQQLEFISAMAALVFVNRHWPPSTIIDETVSPVQSPPPVRRISDLQRSAFWIYGVTGLVMRDPLGLVIRHISDAGIRNGQVRLEVLRIAVILLLISRLFLFSGLYFDQVFMRPESGDRFPRRSYPIDFLNGLSQFLVAAAATTVIGLHSLIAGWFSPFTLLVYVFLLADWIWLAIAKLRRFSSLPLIAGYVVSSAVIVFSSAVAGGIALATGAGAVVAGEAALLVIAAITLWRILKLVQAFELTDSA
jgi:hypothetical protein